MILTSLQKMPNNVGDLGKIIIATGIEIKHSDRMLQIMVLLLINTMLNSSKE